MRASLVRPALVLAATAAVVAGLPAVAAPAKPVCNIVTDAKGDTFLLRTQDGLAPGPQEDALDIVSADLASDAKKITAVIRVAKLAESIATGRGQSYEMQFLTDGTDNTLYLSATLLEGTKTFSAGFRDATANSANSLGEATGTFDLAKNEVRITAPVSFFSGQGNGAKVGTKLAIGDITASRNAVAVNVFADVAVDGAAYTAGTPSCVVPGK